MYIYVYIYIYIHLHIFLYIHIHLHICFYIHKRFLCLLLTCEVLSPSLSFIPDVFSLSLCLPAHQDTARALDVSAADVLERKRRRPTVTPPPTPVNPFAFSSTAIVAAPPIAPSSLASASAISTDSQSPPVQSAPKRAALTTESGDVSKACCVGVRWEC